MTRSIKFVRIFNQEIEETNIGQMVMSMEEQKWELFKHYPLRSTNSTVV